jgi:hypothetical protein
MTRIIGWVIAALVLAGAPVEAFGAKYSVKMETAAVPKELKEPIAKLLSDRAVQLLDDKGTLLCELWFRKEIPVNATPIQVKNGLSYRELEESTILGAVRLPQLMTDYRKQKIQPGVYTVRLGFQPMDGDHMGTAPYSEFGLLLPAAMDEKPDTLPAKELRELSGKAAGGTHPAVFLLHPNNKPQDPPTLVNKGGGIWVLNLKEEVNAGGQKGSFGIALTLIGHAE